MIDGQLKYTYLATFSYNAFSSEIILKKVIMIISYYKITMFKKYTIIDNKEDELSPMLHICDQNDSRAIEIYIFSYIFL